jgi:hypothetical protein
MGAQKERTRPILQMNMIDAMHIIFYYGCVKMKLSALATVPSHSSCFMLKTQQQ